MNLRDFTHLRPKHLPGFPAKLYGASSPDGPWFRLSKRETQYILRQLSQNATPQNTADKTLDSDHI